MSDEAKAAFEDSEVAKDTLFDLLSSPRRRFILYYLHEEEPNVTLQDLADAVGAWEYEKPADQLERQERKRVYVSLYQTHIPKLAESGIIDYDVDSGQIELTDQVNEFGPYLGWEDRPRPWQAIYVGAALMSGLFYLLVTFDISVFALVPEVVAGGIVIGAFAGIAIWHYLHVRRTRVDFPIELIDNRSG